MVENEWLEEAFEIIDKRYEHLDDNNIGLKLIPYHSTSLPVSLIDLSLGIGLPISIIGIFYKLPECFAMNFVAAIPLAAMGTYGIVGFVNWREKRGIKKINFKKDFGVSSRFDDIPDFPLEEREREIKELTSRVNDEYTGDLHLDRKDLAVVVDSALTNFIANTTEQYVDTTTRIRRWQIPLILFPFALGICDPISGEVCLNRSTGVFEPSVIGHEFSHRKGYSWELEAQVLSYLALSESKVPYLVQSANCERLIEDVSSISDSKNELFNGIKRLGLRPELECHFLERKRKPGLYERAVSKIMLPLYNARMKLTGQKGLIDYDQGFTKWLYNYEKQNKNNL